jgi:hypothetical protein
LITKYFYWITKYFTNNLASASSLLAKKTEAAESEVLLVIFYKPKSFSLGVFFACKED